MRVINPVIILLAACEVSVFGFSGSGYKNKSAAFLDIGSGAGPVSLGQAYVSIAEGADGFFYNPAGLSFSGEFELSNMTALLGLDRSIFNVGALYPVSVKADEMPEIFSKVNPLIDKYFEKKKYHKYGFGVYYSAFGVNDIEGRDEWGVKTGSFSDREEMLMLAGGLRLYENLGIGAGVKVIRQKLESAKAQGGCLDAGLIYKLPQRGVSIGVSAVNISNGLKWEVVEPNFNIKSKYREEIRAKYSIGSSARFGDWLVSCDLNKTEGIKFKPNLGAEYSYLDYLKLRAGFNGRDPVFGVGLNSLLAKQLDTNFDYAFMYDMDGLSNTHYLSISLKFNI